MEKKARGLFDEQFRLDKIGKQNDPLVKLQQHIDFEIFRKPLENTSNLVKTEAKEAAGTNSRFL